MRSSNPSAGKFYRRAMLPNLAPVGAEFAACTIIAKNYLGMARVLAESFQKHNPGCPFFVLLLDPVDGYFAPEKESFRLLETRQLAIPNLESFLFKYSILEASTAVKPTLLKKLFAEHDVQKLIYLDPDILVLSSLKELAALLGEYSVVLTPHITRPYPDAAKPGDHDILQAGSYNLGFIGLQNTAVTQQLLNWWEDKLYHHGLVAFDRNMFVDQRWMDLAPALFGDIKILREPGYNVAYWNLHERQVSLQGEQVLVNGNPCRFFHFSGFNPEDMSVVSKHQNRFKMRELGDTKSLFARYRDLVLDRNWKESKNWPYTYDFFDNGIRIPESARRLYWSLGEQAEGLGDPFTWMNETADNESVHPVASRDEERAYGVNIVGYITSEKGVGEAARSNIRILKATGIPFVANNFVDTGSRNLEPIPREFSESNPYRINLINVNADQMSYFAERNNGYLKGHYNIGYWAWELADFPKEWMGSFSYLQEIWAPSNFTRDSIAQRSPLPVICVPHCIDPDLCGDPEWTRKRLQLSPDVFVFLFLFDFHSFLERKNPVGVIQAFKRAFGDRRDVLLLMKSVHADADPAALRLLKKEAQGANIRLFDEVLNRQAIYALMQMCDCYVSLHRSEGFGLTLAEAMQCGKPVIATGYSGNTDFMTPDNSFRVSYRLTDIKQDHGPYKRGSQWADPDLNEASFHMRRVVDDRELLAAVGQRGRADVMAKLHPNRVGELVKARLESLNLVQNTCALT